LSGVAIVRYLLANNSNLLAQVPAVRIRAGSLPLNTVLPAISVTQVSGVQQNNLAMDSASYLVEDRVQVTVLAKTYPEIKTILDLVRKACPLSHGTVNGFTCEGVLPDIEGPDLEDHVQGVHSQSQDFMVSYQRSAT